MNEIRFVIQRESEGQCGEISLERAQIVALIATAITETLRNPKKTALPKPTIEELEKILNSEDYPPKIDILPDGSVTTELPIYAADLANAIVDALAAA